MAASWTSVEIPGFSGRFLHFALWHDVSNVPDIIDGVKSGDLPLASLLKPSLVLNKFVLCAAASAVLVRERDGTMKTRNVSSELIFLSSPSKHITAAFKVVGVDPSDTSILIASLDADEAILTTLSNAVKGNLADSFSPDEDAIARLFGITDVEAAGSSLEDSVVTRVATKGFR